MLAEEVDINRFDPDYYPLQLGNHVLGGGFYATRLYHDLRQVAGYVYNVDVSLSASKTRASYSVTYGCDPENVSKARALIQRDLNQMRTENVTPRRAAAGQGAAAAADSAGRVERGHGGGRLAGRAVIGLPLDEPIAGRKALCGSECGRSEGRIREARPPGGFCSGGARSGSAVTVRQLKNDETRHRRWDSAPEI